MGLAERRASKEFQDTQFPALKAAMDAAAGFPVTLSVNWDQLSQEGVSHGYAEAWPKIYFQTVTDAFASVARDAMGKDALKAGLKSVVFQNTADRSSASSAITFTDGVLTVDHGPYTNVDNIRDRVDHTIATLEKAL